MVVIEETQCTKEQRHRSSLLSYLPAVPGVATVLARLPSALCPNLAPTRHCSSRLGQRASASALDSSASARAPEAVTSREASKQCAKAVPEAQGAKQERA